MAPCSFESDALWTTCLVLQLWRTDPWSHVQVLLYISQCYAKKLELANHFALENQLNINLDSDSSHPVANKIEMLVGTNSYILVILSPYSLRLIP